jgi:hypothetical protein
MIVEAFKANDGQFFFYSLIARRRRAAQLVFYTTCMCLIVRVFLATIKRYDIVYSFCVKVIAEGDMQKCSDLEKIWKYINETLMEGLYDPKQEQYVNGIDSLRLSPPLLIQTRRPSMLLLFPENFEACITCISSRYSHDERLSLAH